MLFSVLKILRTFHRHGISSCKAIFNLQRALPLENLGSLWETFKRHQGKDLLEDLASTGLQAFFGRENVAILGQAVKSIHLSWVAS